MRCLQGEYSVAVALLLVFGFEFQLNNFGGRWHVSPWKSWWKSRGDEDSIICLLRVIILLCIDVVAH